MFHDPHQDPLPNDIMGRMALGGLCATYLPFSALCLYGLTFAPQAPTWVAWLIRAAVWEFMLALTMASLFGLIWAIAAPAWVRAHALRWTLRLCLLSLVPFLILAGLYFWPL